MGSILEILFSSAGYHVRLLEVPLTGERIPTLGEVDVVLFGARLPAKLRKVLLHMLESTPETLGVPVLELTTASGGEPGGQVIPVPWPCQMKEQEQQIDAVLREQTAVRRTSSWRERVVPSH